MTEIRATLERANTVLVVSHVDPDGDALGTMLAVGEFLQDIGKTVIMVRDSEIPTKYTFLPGVENILASDNLPVDLNIDTAVVLECPTLKRAGRVERLLTQDVAIVNIDHHRDATPFGSINWFDTSASSVGEMMFEYFQSVGHTVSRRMATNLYTAILTDTGRFRYGSTSPRTMQIAGELMERGADSRAICDQVYFNMPASTMLLTGKVLATMEYHREGSLCLLTLTKAMLAEAGATDSESDGLVDYTLYSSGVTAGALLKEVNENRTKASLRSGDHIDVAAIAAGLGGGGHVNAAGCTIELPLAEAKAKILQLLKEANVSSK